jgi:hypothetical protein
LHVCTPVDVDLPEEVAIQQKLAGKKTFNAGLFKSSDDENAQKLRQEVENQPDWWNSTDGKLLRNSVAQLQMHVIVHAGLEL